MAVVVMDPWIAKEKFDSLSSVVNRIEHAKFVECIEDRPNYFSWIEDTVEGRKTLAAIDQIPEKFRQKVLRTHSKNKALADYDATKGFHLISVGFLEGVVGTTFQRSIGKQDLEWLLDLAECLEAMVINGDGSDRVLTRNDL